MPFIELHSLPWFLLCLLIIDIESHCLPQYLKAHFSLSHFSLEYCQKYAKPEDAGVIPEDKSSDEELSEDENDSGDEEIMGKPDP